MTPLEFIIDCLQTIFNLLAVSPHMMWQLLFPFFDSGLSR